MIEGLHQHPGPPEQKDDEAIMECINVTSMEKSMRSSPARAVRNAVTTFQEHKLRPGEISKMKDLFKKAHLKVERSPSDQTTKLPRAGVGIAAQSDIVLARPKIRCEAFRQAQEAGRVDKHMQDLGWEQNLLCLVIYGVSGGSNEAKDETEAITEAIKEEIGEYSEMPAIIKRDFNRTPNELSTLKELIEDEAWTDLGSVVEWWGRTQPDDAPNESGGKGDKN